MRILFICILAALLALSAEPSAATPSDPAGRWALHASGRTLVVLELKRGAAPGSWTGLLERPTSLQVTSFGFAEVAGPIVPRKVKEGTEGPDGLQLMVEGPAGSEDDLYVLKLIEGGVAELRIKGAPIPPLLLVRAAADERVAASWDKERLYHMDWDYPANARMKAIFEADQGDRKDPPSIDWAVVGPRDEARRVETKKLLDEGKLRTGDDYYRAAFVFQHGDKPDDFLFAHVLATVAIARGRADATWIAAATLDRYLQRIDRKQIFGTQFVMRDGATQEPYDRMLVSDALRAAMGVPSQAEQEKRRAAFEAQFRAAKPAP